MFDSDEDDDDDDDGVGFFPSISSPRMISRSGTTSITRFRIELESHPSSSTSASNRTVDLASSPQRSYAVSGQGSAARPLEIADSDDE